MNTLFRFAALGAALVAAAPAADFSYYILALSYAPEFCAHPGGRKDPRECGPGRRPFVVHGLWPQNENSRGPERCGPARPVAASLVNAMLKYFPTESLIQHEWATHGTCSGLTPAEYFDAVRRAADSIRLPDDLAPRRAPVVISPQELELRIARQNPGIPPDAIRTACYPDGGLEEIRVCFDKNLAPRPCAGLSECTRMAVRLLPALP